jgi:hypothetical protein
MNENHQERIDRGRLAVKAVAHELPFSAVRRLGCALATEPIEKILLASREARAL